MSAAFGTAIRITCAFFLVLYMSWLGAYLNIPASMRPDLFFFLLLALGFLLSPLAHLVFAVVVGYLVDTLAGKLWGLHVATYVIMVSFMRASSDQLDVYSPLFHALLVVAYVTLQQIFIFLYARGLWHETGTEFFVRAWFVKTLVSVVTGVPFVALLMRFMRQERT